MLPSPDGLFVGEERDAESKSVSFFCLERESGTVRWSNVQHGERWWVSIEAVYRDVVILHEYATPDLPDHRKMHVLDIATGTVRWSNDDLKFLFVSGDCVYASRDLHDSRIFYELEIHTGSIVREVESAELNVLGEAITGIGEIDFPRVFDSAARDNSPVSRAIENATRSAKRIDLIEYIEKCGMLVIGYFDNVSDDPVGQVFNQHLVITDEETWNNTYEDDVTVNGSAPVPDTFFSMGNFLYYIKDKRVLRAINLSSRMNRNGND